MNNYAYLYNGKLYLNITNKCSNNCVFCLRNNRNGVEGDNLWLSRDAMYEDVINSLKKFDLQKYDEITFCGFGEPVCNFEVLKQTAKYLKSLNKKVRLNTNGQGNIINGRNIAPELKGIIDSVSISLNASNARNYQKLCRSRYGENAYDAVIEFAKECAKVIGDVTLTKVDEGDSEENAACKNICDSLGIKFRLRKKI